MPVSHCLVRHLQASILGPLHWMSTVSLWCVAITMSRSADCLCPCTCSHHRVLLPLLESGIIVPAYCCHLKSSWGLTASLGCAVCKPERGLLLLVCLQDQQHEVELSSLSQAVLARTQPEQHTSPSAPCLAPEILQQAQHSPQQQQQLQDTLMQLQHLCLSLSQQLQTSPASPQ